MSDQQPDPWVTVEWRTNPLSGEQWGYRKDVDAARAEDARRHAFELSREYERGSADGVARMRVQIDELKQDCEAANRRHAEEVARWEATVAALQKTVANLEDYIADDGHTEELKAKDERIGALRQTLSEPAEYAERCVHCVPREDR